MASFFCINENQLGVQHTVQSADALYFPQLPVSIPRLWNAALPLAASHLSCRVLADPSGMSQGKVHTCSGNWCLSLAAGAACTEENSSCPMEAAKGCTALQGTRLKLFENTVSKETNTELFSALHGYALSKQGRVTCFPHSHAASGGKFFPRKGDGELLRKVLGWQRGNLGSFAARGKKHEGTLPEQASLNTLSPWLLPKSLQSWGDILMSQSFCVAADPEGNSSTRLARWRRERGCVPPQFWSPRRNVELLEHVQTPPRCSEGWSTSAMEKG